MRRRMRSKRMAQTACGRGMTMKWLRKHKSEIIWGVQAFIVLDTMVTGFWFIYLFALFLFGLPMEWWAMVIAMVASLLSMIGTLAWIKKENDNG